ncbi:MAG: hypothetical protein AB1730_04890 [Myxococcota bacterium]|jgi:hypothetical protein
MRLPLLFRRENSSAARRERQAQLERAVTEGLRRLSDLLKTVADQIEARRLERRGYEQQDRFLERTDKAPR